MSGRHRRDAAAPDPARVEPAARTVNRLGRELAATRTQYANLLAAARATLTAAQDGDPYALEFLADELVVQHGQLDLDDETARVRRPRLRAETRWWEVGR